MFRTFALDIKHYVHLYFANVTLGKSGYRYLDAVINWSYLFFPLCKLYDREAITPKRRTI